jgi:hypothetical protein
VLRPLSPAEAAGIPIAEQFTVRDAAGRSYLPLQIAIRESRFEPEHYADVLREAPEAAMIDGVAWTVHVVFVSENDAPAA